MSNNLTGMKFMQRKLRADAERAEDVAREREISKAHWVAPEGAGADAGGQGAGRGSRLHCTRFDSDAFDPQVADADAAQSLSQFGGGGRRGGGDAGGVVFVGVAGRRSYGGFNGKLEATAEAQCNDRARRAKQSVALRAEVDEGEMAARLGRHVGTGGMHMHMHGGGGGGGAAGYASAATQGAQKRQKRRANKKRSRR